MSNKSSKLAVRAIRVARMAIEIFIQWNESGEGGPIGTESLAKLARVKAEADILMAVLDEVLSRKEPDQ